MLPVNPGGHSVYQNFVVDNLRKYYPNPSCMQRSYLLSLDFIVSSLTDWAAQLYVQSQLNW